MEKSEINQSLLAHLRALPGYEQLISDLETGQFAQASRFGLGLPRSARLALLAAIHEDLNHPILLLTNRADRALSLFDEIGFWLPDSKLFYYPEPNPLFYEPLSWSVSTRRERIQVLSELARFHLPGVQTKQTAPVLVAPIRAIMTKTLPRRDFLRQTKKITKGQTIAFEGLLRQWIGIGYEHSNIVVQTGQISRRGGILDIWSPGSDLPVRIEFFGDEIETLRSFNPATQLTVQPLEQVVIYPAREILTLDAEKKGFLAEGLEEHQLAEVYSFPASLIDYLPEQSIIMLDGEEFIAAAVNDIEEESIARRTELIQEGNLNPDAAVPYITWSEIEDGFHGVLTVVEVAACPKHADVPTALRDHLLLLDVRDTVSRVEDHNAGVGAIGKAFKGGLPSVAGGGHQDQIVVKVLARRPPQRNGLREQQRHALQGHVFKGGGGPVPQFQYVHAGGDLHHRSHSRVVEVGAKRLGHKNIQPVVGDVHPERPVRGGGARMIGETAQRHNLVQAQ